MGVGESVARCRKSSILARSTFDVERDVVADAVQASIVAVFRTRTIWPLRREMRAAQRGIHGVEPGVAIGRIHARMEVVWSTMVLPKCESLKSGVSVSPSTLSSRSVPW